MIIEFNQSPIKMLHHFTYKLNLRNRPFAVNFSRIRSIVLSEPAPECSSQSS
jgi:hypothetical protein